MKINILLLLRSRSFGIEVLSRYFINVLPRFSASVFQWQYDFTAQL
jgi:hypothetical protein